MQPLISYKQAPLWERQPRLLWALFTVAYGFVFFGIGWGGCKSGQYNKATLCPSPLAPPPLLASPPFPPPPLASPPPPLPPVYQPAAPLPLQPPHPKSG